MSRNRSLDLDKGLETRRGGSERSLRSQDRPRRGATPDVAARPAPAPHVHSPGAKGTPAGAAGGTRRRKDEDRRAGTASGAIPAGAIPGRDVPKRTGRQGRVVDVSGTPEKITELKKLARSIRTSHEQILWAYRNSLRHAVQVGRLLTQAKGLVPHGQFKRWIEENCPEIAPRTATDYMRVAEAEVDGRLSLVEESNRRPAADLTLK
jgi:hypothetical protein